jgi:hypothetical protein
VPEIEDQLTAVAGALEWPVTPDIWPRISERIVPARRAALAWWRPLGIAVAALLIVALALLAFQPSRDAIATWLYTRIERVQQLPSPSQRPPGQLGEHLGLGKPVTREQAQGLVRWHIAAPSALGQPNAIYVQDPANGPTQGEVSLVYATAPGVKVAGETGVAVLITEARGKVNETIFGKMLGPSSTVEAVTVNGHQGWWISGSPHDFIYVDPDGTYRSETMRLATNTLIFDNNGTIVRIEADTTRDRALGIASSMS